MCSLVNMEWIYSLSAILSSMGQPQPLLTGSPSLSRLVESVPSHQMSMQKDRSSCRILPRIVVCHCKRSVTMRCGQWVRRAKARRLPCLLHLSVMSVFPSSLDAPLLWLPFLTSSFSNPSKRFFSVVVPWKLKMPPPILCTCNWSMRRMPP